MLNLSLRRLILRTVLLGCLGAALLPAPAQAQPQLVDCSCLATQAVLITNACQAVIPDLCQFTNCWRSTAVPPPVLTCSQTPPAGTPVGPGAWGITLTITDPNGVSQSCPLTFTVTPPVAGCGQVFTLLCATNKTVECGTTWNFDPPTWTNACVPPPGTPSNGVVLTIVSTVTNGTCPMVITRTWQGVDDCGHIATCSQTVTVVDTTPPVLDCNCLTNSAVFPPVPLIVIACTTNIPDLCQSAKFCATDRCGTPTCSQTPAAGTAVGPGSYSITVIVTDCAGNKASCVVNFTVIAPSTGCGQPFALLCATNKTVECGTTWNFNPPTWTNACVPPPGTPSNGVVLTIVSTVTNGTCPMVITRTWQGVDDCGHVATCSQTVTVVDTTPPVLNCVCLTNSAVFPPVPLTVIACSNPIPALCQSALFCATDNCGPLTCTQSPPAGTVVGPGTYPITVTVRDCASNSASCVVNFTVIAPASGCTTNPCITPPSGMVAWWPLDELTGATLFLDATGNGHTAIVESGGPVGNGGSPTSWPVGKVAGANYFYGLSPRGRAVNVPTLNFNTNSFSVDCWANPVLTGPVHWHPIVDKLNQTGPATGFGYAVGLLNTKVVLKVGDGTLFTYTSLGSVSYSVWNFVAVVVDRTANTVTFHVNGVTESPQTLAPAGYFNSGVDLLIGSTHNGSIALGELAVDELELFNRTLATTEMNALWTADSRGKCKTNSCIVSIFCPTNLVATRSCTQTCATVTYPAPLVSNGALAGCTPPSGSCFPLGATTVICTATNACGQPATCNFTITVNASTNCQPCDYTLAHTLNSGTAGGALLPTGALEPLWFNAAAPGGSTPMVVVDTNLWPIAGGPWLAPTAQSAWVGPSTSSQGPAGWYTNRWTFNSPCTNVCLRGRFATDDDGYLYVNGNLVPGSSGFTAWTTVYVCNGFVVGPNTIELVVHNAGGPTGFRTELEIWNQCCCSSQTKVWNTGMGGVSGNVLLGAGVPDPNYTLVSAPPGGCTGPAQVLDTNTIPVPPWLGTGPNSQWIGGGLTADCQGGVYHYRICFYLPCTEGASIIGRWTADDWGEILLNGQPTGLTVPSTQNPNTTFGGWHPVVLTNGFVCGNNCLDFYVTNAYTFDNPTGFRAELTNVFDDCCCRGTPVQSSVFSGRDANGLLAAGATDNQFSLTCAPQGVTATVPVVIQPSFVPSSWVPNDANSQWIGPDQFNNAPPGVYCYTYRFNIACPPGVPIKASLTGRWTADDTGSLLLNGQPTSANLPPSWAFTNWHGINITSGFVSGLNTLTFYVTNGGGPTGLRLELTNSASCCNCTNTCTVSISCPSDIDLHICGTNGMIVYPPPTATNSCGSAVTIVCTPPSISLFPLGTTTVNCTATDAMGNSASCSFKVILRPDVTPPTVDCACLQSHLPIRIVACKAVVPDLCVFTDCYSDNCTPVGQLRCTQSPPAGTVLPAGASYLITVTITDAAGNSNQCQVGFSVIAPVETRVWNTGMGGPSGNVPLSPGVTDPSFALVSFPTGGCPGPAQVINPAGIPGSWVPASPGSQWIGPAQFVNTCAAGVYRYQLRFDVPCTNGASIAGRFAADDTAAIYLNGQPTGVTPANFTGWTPVSITSGFVMGPNVLDVYVTNSIIYTGLRAELTNTFTCCCPEAIALTCPRPLRACVCAPNGAASVPYTVTATSRCPGSNVTVTVTCSPPSPGPFPVGTTTVNCTATDSLGNQVTCSFPVTVVRDTTPPVVSCPAPITRVICANSVRVYYKATARDDCSGILPVTCVPPSGTLFNVGTTTVTCSATDACGNTGSCSFPVKIINNAIWQTLPCGINDCYAQSGFEPNVRGTCLQTAYPGGPWKNFDVTTVNRWVGHTWTFPLSWNILGAQLATRARPPVNGCAGISGNDSINLGLANCNTPAWLWSRYLGSGNASPGLVDKQWCNGSGCNYLFNLNLAALPLTPSGTTSLLPHMNSVKRLDLFFQDDSTVDFADLRVLRCAPFPVLGGLGVELSNAQLVYGPVTWCLARDLAGPATFSAQFSLGEADGVRFPLEPLALADHAGASLRFGAVGADAVHFPSLDIGTSADGTGEVHLGDLPAGVTELERVIEVDGTVVQRDTAPAAPGMSLATFTATDPLAELAVGNQNELLATILSGEPGQPPARITLRIRFLGYSGKPQAASLVVARLDELALLAPELQVNPPAGADRAVALRMTSSDAGLAEISGGQGVVSPLDSSGMDTVSFTASFPPTNEFRALLPSPFGLFGPVASNAALRSIVRGLVDGEEVDVDLASFNHTDAGFDFTWSSTRIHPVRKIYWVIGPARSAQIAVPGESNVVVTVPELPIMHGKLGGRTPCRRFTWPKPTSLSVAGQVYEATELRVLVETENYPVTALTGLRVEAEGAESLTLPQIETGAEQYRLDPPEISPDGLWLRWSGFSGVLEEAPTVLGPWTPTPNQAEQTQGEVLTPLDPATPAKFFRVRGE